MAEPVDPADDWAVTRGARRTVQYREFDPAEDGHGDAEECEGVRGPARTAAEGGVVVTRRTWTLSGLTARPILRSWVVDGADTWVVESVTPDPAAGEVYRVDTHKG